MFLKAQIIIFSTFIDNITCQLYSHFFFLDSGAFRERGSRGEDRVADRRRGLQGEGDQGGVGGNVPGFVGESRRAGEEGIGGSRSHHGL